MIEILNRLEHFCNASGINLDSVLKTFDEPQRVDNMDVNDLTIDQLKQIREIFRKNLADKIKEIQQKTSS